MKKFLLGVVMTVTLAVFCGATFQTTKYSYEYKWLGSGGTNKIKDAERNAKIAVMTNAGWRLVDIRA